MKAQTHRGLADRARGGFATGGRVYGFRTVTEPDPTDPGHPQKLIEIHPEQATVVRRIFESYVEGTGLVRIAKSLNVTRLVDAIADTGASAALTSRLREKEAPRPAEIAAGGRPEGLKDAQHAGSGRCGSIICPYNRPGHDLQDLAGLVGIEPVRMSCLNSSSIRPAGVPDASGVMTPSADPRRRRSALR